MRPFISSHAFHFKFSLKFFSLTEKPFSAWVGGTVGPQRKKRNGDWKIKKSYPVSGLRKSRCSWWNFWHSRKKSSCFRWNYIVNAIPLEWHKRASAWIIPAACSSKNNRYSQCRHRFAFLNFFIAYLFFVLNRLQIRPPFYPPSRQLEGCLWQITSMGFFRLWKLVCCSRILAWSLIAPPEEESHYLESLCVYLILAPQTLNWRKSLTANWESRT